MSKSTLIERMEKAKAPKTWIREVKTKDDLIGLLVQQKETYMRLIDELAREKEKLETENETLREDRGKWKEQHEALFKMACPDVNKGAEQCR